MKIKSDLNIFTVYHLHCYLYFLCIIICLLATGTSFPTFLLFLDFLDPDPHSECGSGSRRPPNADTMRIRLRNTAGLLVTEI
jgi:hypothetical protein